MPKTKQPQKAKQSRKPIQTLDVNPPSVSSGGEALYLVDGKKQYYKIPRSDWSRFRLKETPPELEELVRQGVVFVDLEAVVAEQLKKRPLPIPRAFFCYLLNLNPLKSESNAPTGIEEEAP